MDTSAKLMKIEKAVSLLDMFKVKDEKIQPRKFYGQEAGLTKVQLYPKMGGESDQIDGMRKDGTDAMENKNVIDPQVTIDEILRILPKNLEKNMVPFLTVFLTFCFCAFFDKIVSRSLCF